MKPELKISDIFDDNLLLYIKSFISYFTFEYIINAIALIVFLVAMFLCIKRKMKRPLLYIVPILIAIATSFITMNIYWSLHKRDKSSLNIAVCDVYTFDKAHNYAVPSSYSSFSNEIITQLKSARANNKSFESTITTNYHKLQPLSYELLIAKNLPDVFKRNKYKNKYDIIVYGVSDKSGRLSEIRLFFTGSDDDETLTITKETVSAVGKNDDLAQLIYIFISQSISVSASKRFQNSSIGISILSDAEKLTEALFNKKPINTSKEEAKRRVKFILKLNMAQIYTNMHEYENAISQQLEALRIKPYFPFSTYEDFKQEYNGIYASAVAGKVSEVYDINKESKVKASKIIDRLRNYGKEHLEDEILLHQIESNILNCSDFNKCVSIFENYKPYFKTNSVFYLYLGDTYKYYKSKAFDINLDTIDKAIYYYEQAYNQDKTWLLPILKIGTAKFLKCIKKSGAENCADIIKSYEDGLEAFSNSLEYRKFVGTPE